MLGIYFLSFLFFYHYQFQSNYIPDIDGYYHIKLAYLLREQGFIENFPWASLSLWADQFSDKEFLFHLFLIPFTYFENLEYGAKLATVTLASFAITSFYIILKLNKVRFSWFWFLLLTSAGGYFLYRINVPRAQIMSVSFVLWAIHFVINQKRKSLFFLSWIYTYAYTAFFLPFGFALIQTGYLFFFEKKSDFKTPLYAFLGMLLGSLLHPYFPNNLLFFYVQNFYVFFMSQAKVDLHMGGELYPMDTKQMLLVNTSVILAYFSVFFHRLISQDKVNVKVATTFLISLVLIILTFISKRFAEYSSPVTLMFCALYFKPYLDDLSIKNLFKSKPFKTSFIGLSLLILILILQYRSYIDVYPQFRRGPSNFQSAALKLKEYTDENEVVYTCDWDDAPELFFFNHYNRYLIFLDPNFMYYKDPSLWKTWDNLSNGRLNDQTYDIFKNQFKIRFGVCTNNFITLRNLIREDPKMSVIYQDKHAYIFKLAEDHRKNHNSIIDKIRSIRED